MNERRLKEVVVARLKREPKLFFYKTVGGMYQMPGLPDIIACWQGRFLGIELKTKNRTLTKLQKVVRDAIINSGGLYWVIRTLTELETNLKKEVQYEE